MLDFLGLKDTYSEKDLGAALLRESERFLLELGAGLAFVERQKRIVVDGDAVQHDDVPCKQRERSQPECDPNDCWVARVRPGVVAVTN